MSEHEIKTCPYSSLPACHPHGFRTSQNGISAAQNHAVHAPTGLEDGKASFSEVNGASLKEVNGSWDDVPIFSSECDCFEWRDAETDNARALAEKFITRFPDVAKRGLGRDWTYAGWLSELLGVLENGDYLPVVEWEFMKGTRDQLMFVPIWSFFDGAINLQWDESVYLSEPVEGALQFPLPPKAEL